MCCGISQNGMRASVWWTTMGVDCLRHASCPICSGTMESLPDGELGLAQGARICGACAMSCRGAVDSSSTCSSYVSSACATERLCVCQSSPDARAVSHHWHCARRPSSRRRGPPDHPSRGPVPTWHSSGTEASRPRLSSPLARSHPERSRSADKSAALRPVLMYPKTTVFQRAEHLGDKYTFSHPFYLSRYL